MDTSQIIGGLAALAALALFVTMAFLPIILEQLKKTEEGAE